jgi:hypothetical protein
MSYYVTNENSFLDIKNAHLRVTGNVHTDVLKLGAIEFQPTGSEVTGTVNFTNVTTGVTTSSNLNVGGTLQLGTVEVVATTHTLANTTALGNVTPHTIQFSNVTTSLTADSNILVTGNVTAATFLGDGSGLTALNATNIASGTLDVARIPDLDTAKITTGTLPVARGGTGVTGSTGTGSVVLSDAPTFTGTPALSSAASITGTSDGVLSVQNTTTPAIARMLTTGGQVYFQSGIAATSDSRADTNFTSMYNGTNYLKIQGSTGNVGIGTTSPGEKLHVNGNLRLGSSLNNSVDDDTEYSISTAGQLIIKSNDSGINGSYVGLQLQSGNVNPGKIVIGGGSVDQYKDIEFYTSGSSTERMRIHHNGNVGIGTTSPAYRLHIQDGNASMAQFGPSTSYPTSSLVVGAGTSQASATAGVICQMITTNGNMHLDAATSRDIYMNHYTGSYIRHGGSGLLSDDRLKTNEELITNATETLLKLSPQKYTKARSLREAETREPFTETGLIAQDIWYDAPELRHVVLLGTDADPVEIKPEAPVEGDIQQDPDYSSWGPHEASVNYDGLIAYLIKSNQELHARIQALENA